MDNLKTDQQTNPQTNPQKSQSDNNKDGSKEMSKGTKIKNFIFRNIGLKILSLIIAVILWIVVVNVDDPSVRQTIGGITVDLLNESSLDAKGYTYSVEAGSVISVVVRGPQSVVESLKASDFYAYADLSERSPSSDTAPISVTCTNEEYSGQIDIISQKYDYVTMSIDNKINKEVALSFEYTGNPSNGYVVGSVGISPTAITVTGAETTINTISYAKLTYDVSDLTASVNDSIAPIFYDADGKEVDTSLLELSRSTVQVSIEILPSKSVPINFAISGEPEEGYIVTGYTPSFEEVVIAAEGSLLEAISSIDIPSGIIDVTGLTESETITVSLVNYLSSGYTIVSPGKEFSVKVEIEPQVEKTVNIPYERIKVTGLDSDYTLEFETENGGKSELNVVVKGVQDVVESITASTLGATISLDDRLPGKYSLRVDFNSADDYIIEDSYFVSIVIRNSEEETTTEKESESETGETKENESTEEETTLEGETTESETETTAPSAKEGETEAQP